MAKLRGPLFSLGASGQIAKTLVYFPWKGLECVRSYVVPSNPNTSAQDTWRQHVTDAVAKIHATQALAVNGLDEVDLMAYSELGRTRKGPRTWFNEIVKTWLDVIRAGLSPVVYSDGTVSDPTTTTIDMILYLNEKVADDLNAGKFYFGSSPTSMIHSAVATLVTHVSVALVAQDLSAFLAAGKKYYWQFKPDVADPCEGAVSGIYNFVTD